MIIQPQDNTYSLSEHENSIGCNLTKWWLNVTVFSFDDSSGTTGDEKRFWYGRQKYCMNTNNNSVIYDNLKHDDEVKF
jgi:hypothetical protein